MELREPVIITPQLLPGVAVRQGQDESAEVAFISIDYSKQAGSEGRTRYTYHIDLPSGESYSDSDLSSGAQGGDLQSGLEDLLSFLGGAGECYGYNLRQNPGFLEDIEAWAKLESGFPLNVAEWAYQVSDELDMLRLDLEEMDGTMDELAIVE